MLIRKRLNDKVANLQKLTHAVAHRHRLAILYLLSHGSKATYELADTLIIKEPLLVHHLEIMVKSGWIRRIRQGRRVWYELEKTPFVELMKFLGDTPFFRDLRSR
ncbi:helix-turn-helix transcriptional regulator [Candidatus Gottesmanbacteria bacterium]|nr:helix-turn-helix transcriptional regulator [Candidatus Gottesmanbacteria bacterium]